MKSTTKVKNVIAVKCVPLRQDTAHKVTEEETKSEDVIPSSNDEVSLNRSRRLASDVSGDHHRQRLRKVFRIATWNVRTLNGDGKLDMLTREIHRTKVDIVGLSEVRWEGEGHFSTADGDKVYFSGGNGSERGVAVLVSGKIAKAVLGYKAVSDRIMTVRIGAKHFNTTIIQLYAPTSKYDDDTIEDWYEQVQETVDQSPKQDIIIIMGDMNAKVGKSSVNSDVVGRHGLGDRNDRGDRLVQFCQAPREPACSLQHVLPAPPKTPLHLVITW